MTIDPDEAREFEFFQALEREILEDFSRARLKSFYLEFPGVMCPAVEAIKEGRWQQEQEHYAAAVVFFVSAIEILLKAVILRPVVFGLVHNERLAEAVTQQTLREQSLDRYYDLLDALFKQIAQFDAKSARREGADRSLRDETRDLQKIRNGIVHRGESVRAQEAETARRVAVATFEEIVTRMFSALGLRAREGGRVEMVQE